MNNDGSSICLLFISFVLLCFSCHILNAIDEKEEGFLINEAQQNDTIPTEDELRKNEAKAFDEELLRRLIAFKYDKERYLKEMFYKEREKIEQNFIKQSRQKAMGIINAEADDLYSYLKMANARNVRGKKKNFEAAPYENGVFKLDGYDNLYLWTQNEKEFMEKHAEHLKGKILDSKEAAMFYEKELAMGKIHPVCRENTSADNLFDNPKQLEFLRGVYYNFLERSKINRTIEGWDLHTSKHYLSLNASETVTDYFEKKKYMALVVAMLDRIHKPSSPLHDGDTFASALPLGMPDALREFYYAHVSIPARKVADIFALTFNAHTHSYSDRQTLKKVMSPRILAKFGYFLATYNKNRRQRRDQNWNYKLSHFYGQPVSGNLFALEHSSCASALYHFYKHVDCLPQLCGLLINPLVPFYGCSPDAITYCQGQSMPVLIKLPFLGQRSPCSKVLTKMEYLSRDNLTNRYKLRENNEVYAELQMSMAILQVSSSFLCVHCLFDNSSLIMRVHFNRDFWHAMNINLYEVYFSKVLPRLFKNNLVVTKDN